MYGIQHGTYTLTASNSEPIQARTYINKTIFIVHSLFTKYKTSMSTIIAKGPFRLHKYGQRTVYLRYVAYSTFVKINKIIVSTYNINGKQIFLIYFYKNTINLSIHTYKNR